MTGRQFHLFNSNRGIYYRETSICGCVHGRFRRWTVARDCAHRRTRGRSRCAPLGARLHLDSRHGILSAPNLPRGLRVPRAARGRGSERRTLAPGAPADAASACGPTDSADLRHNRRSGRDYRWIGKPGAAEAPPSVALPGRQSAEAAADDGVKRLAAPRRGAVEAADVGPIAAGREMLRDEA